jgi:hypothetical protein
MTDPTQAAAPIVVNANPNQDALQTLVRQVIVVAGVVTSALGFTHLAGDFSALLVAAGPIATLIAAAMEVWKSHALASKASTMASALPNSVATTK